jgi:hypothetical protein
MSARQSPERTDRLRVLLCLAASACLGGCVDYVKRRDTVTLGAGDAQAWNRVVHTADPWPPYAANTQIDGDGPRTARTMRNYTMGTPTGAAGNAGRSAGVSEASASGEPSRPAQ